MKDENDKLMSDELPADPRAGTKPLNAQAKAQAEDGARLCFDDEMMRASALRATTRQGYSTLITTGHYQLDNDTGGFEKEFVTFFGADTSWGKSSHVILCSDENLKRNMQPLIVSWEDAEKIYADRFMIKRAGVRPDAYKWHRMGRLSLTSEELRCIQEVERSTPHKPLFLDARGKTVEWVALKIRQMVKAYSVDLVLVDYIQAGNNERPQDNRRAQIEYIARTLVDAIKTSGAAGVIYSQITVTDKKPTPDRHSLKESRDLANMAEMVLLGFEAPKNITPKFGEPISEGQKVIFADKVKNGPPKRIHGMDWNEKHACFKPVLDPLARSYDDYTAELPALPEGWAS